MSRRLQVFSNLDALSRAAADEIARVADRPGSPSVILSGGSTPRRLFELLGTEWRDRIRWPYLHLFWSDERIVPNDDEQNNYHAAAELFLRRVPVSVDHVHRVRVDVERPAQAYQEELLTYFGLRGRKQFDLALLGIGADGHTASLFPGGPLESDRWVEAVIGPASRPPRERVTLTLRSLNSARRVLFMVAGAEKREILKRVLQHDDDLPAARVAGTEVTLFAADSDAAPDVSATSSRESM